jgi:serine O-acetyltransferase
VNAPSGVLRADLLRAWGKLDGSTPRRVVDCARSPGVQAVVVLRFGQWASTLPAMLRLPLGVAYVLLNGLVKVLWGIEIPRRTRIGPGLYIGHFGGIVVNPHAVLGRNCTLSQGVTIGAGAGGAPVLGDDVYIAPGAKVFGAIRVGNNVKIGANAVIHKDLPDNAVAALVPGFEIISMKGNHPFVQDVAQE